MPDLTAYRRAWRKAAQTSDADPSDGFAAQAAVAAARRLAEALGHEGCGGWYEAAQGLTCNCLALLEPRKAAA